MTAVKNEAVLGCPLVVRRRMTHTAPETHLRGAVSCLGTCRGPPSCLRVRVPASDP